MFTIPKTSFGQINLRAIVAGVGSQCLGCENLLQDAASRMEKDEDLKEMIWSTCCVYARWLKMAWDVKNCDRESSKISQTEQLTNVLEFHEIRMIYGR